jgi:hypothetical protein
MYVCIDIYMNEYVHKNICSRGSLPDMKKSYISNSNIIDAEGMYMHIEKNTYTYVCMYRYIYE